MTLTFRSEVRGPAFLELLLALSSKARTVGLIDDQPEGSEATARLLSSLKGRFLARAETRAWPGTEVPVDEEPSLLLTFGYDADVARALYRACPDLFGWQRKALPCDLHLLDREEQTLFGSITSATDAWVDMRMAEWRGLVSGTRWLRKIKVRDDRG